VWLLDAFYGAVMLVLALLYIGFGKWNKK